MAKKLENVEIRYYRERLGLACMLLLMHSLQQNPVLNVFYYFRQASIYRILILRSESSLT